MIPSKPPPIPSLPHLVFSASRYDWSSAAARPAAKLIFAPSAPLRENNPMSAVAETLPDAQGHFGPYGGRYVPETLMHPLQELEDAWRRAETDLEFEQEFKYYLREFCGRP